MPRTPTRPSVHARYLSWAMRARLAANRGCRERGEPDVLETWSFHVHLFRWAVVSGRLDEPEPLNRSPSWYVALVFRIAPEAVKAEARRYWHRQVKETV